VVSVTDPYCRILGFLDRDNVNLPRENTDIIGTPIDVVRTLV
jgi:hypothetical protein